jgi:hypothetical protein
MIHKRDRYQLAEHHSRSTPMNFTNNSVCVTASFELRSSFLAKLSGTPLPVIIFAIAFTKPTQSFAPYPLPKSQPHKHQHNKYTGNVLISRDEWTFSLSHRLSSDFCEDIPYMQRLCFSLFARGVPHRPAQVPSMASESSSPFSGSFSLQTTSVLVQLTQIRL